MFMIEVMLVLRDIAIALGDLVTGKRRCRYETSIFIAAPRETVWRMVTSKDITYAGLVPLRVIGEPVAERPDLTRFEMVLGERRMVMMLRLVDERPGVACQHEMVAEGSTPAIVVGRDDYIAHVLHDVPGGTRLDLAREITPATWWGHVTIPLASRIGARRYKAKAEQMALATTEAAEAVQDGPWGVSEPAIAPPAKPAVSSFGLTPNGILLSLVALASFSWLWGWQQAVLIAAIIILHELGHALAMLMVGIPVKGIYLVPFFGGAAIAAAPYRSEGQIGFVALMGPAFSLVPTLAFAMAAQETGQPALLQAVQMSAIINLLNLAPIIPFDGGIVLKAALVSMSRTAAQIAGLAGAALGLYGAWFLRDPVLGLFVVLGLLVTRQLKTAPAKEPMRWPSALLLLLAFAATIAAYLAIIATAYAGLPPE